MIPTGQPSIAVSIADASIASAFKRLKTPSSVESINSLIPSSLMRKYCGIVSSHKQHPTHSLALCRITTKDVEVLKKDQFMMPTWGLIILLIFAFFALKFFIYIKDPKRHDK